jgi:non-heme chloroperoxidase
VTGKRGAGRRFDRRAVLQGAAALAVLSNFAGMAGVNAAPAELTGNDARQGGASKDIMAKDIVMLHGASAGGWCFDKFRGVFESLGWTVHTPDLVGHGGDKAEADATLAGIGMADYCAEFASFLKTLPAPPVLLGHSMGAVLAQQLAASGMARSLILVSPAPRAGILPTSDSEEAIAQGFMTIASFWKTVIAPDFALACLYSLNRVPADQQRSVFDRFGPESGRAYFELFFWMLDQTRATAVDIPAVRCPVLCLSGTDDKLVSLATARVTGGAYPASTFWELSEHGHMLLVEPGAEDIARRIADWIAA